MLQWLKRALRCFPPFNSNRYIKWLYDLDTGMFDDELDEATDPVRPAPYTEVHAGASAVTSSVPLRR